MRTPTGTLSVRTSLAILAAASLLAIPASSLAQGVPNNYDFDFVTIGAVGNTPYEGNAHGQNAGRGGVGYEYRMARTELTTSQWMEFVNTFSIQGNDIAGFGRIHSWGAVVDDSYEGPGRRYTLNPDIPHAANLPVFGINWRDCAQFVNWLNNDKSSSPDALTHGAYDTSTFTSNPNGTLNDQLYHDPDAKYWIPTLDEWLKAAHYDPNKFGPGQEGWWGYSTSSDTQPIPGLPGEGQTSAGSPQGPGEPSRLMIPLGAYPDTVSPWGLLDVSGGASEWLEEPSSPGKLRLRGRDGAMAGSAYAAMTMFDYAAFFNGSAPTSGGVGGGLRVASAVPAPAPVVIVASCLAFSLRRARYRA